MKPPIERIRVSQRSRDTLVTLKRRTGSDDWKVLCPWSLLESRANSNTPVSAAYGPDSSVEISWDVFAGEQSDTILATFHLRAEKDGINQTQSEWAPYF